MSSEPECVICLMPINYGDPKWLVHVLDCGHCFHKRCILHWAKTCPICRSGDIMWDVVKINCEITTGLFKKQYKMKIKRDDPMDLIIKFCQERIGIKSKYFQLNSIQNKSFTIDCIKHKPTHDSTLATYISQHESLLDKLIGINTLIEISICVDVLEPYNKKINRNPKKYDFDEIVDNLVNGELFELNQESGCDVCNII